MDIGFDYYKTFCAVAESKSITEAANKLNISQPAITKSIKLLEQSLKTNLFFRNHNGTVLTDEGKKLYDYIKPIVLQLNDTDNIISGLMKSTKSQIRIGTSVTILRLFLIDYIQKYAKDNPKVSIYLEDNTTHNLVSKIKEGAIDIAIIITNNDLLKKYTGIKTYNLKTLNYGLYSNNIYMDPVEKKISIKNIRNKNFIMNNNNYDLNNFQKKHQLNNYINVSSNSFIFDFINAGLGIGLVVKEFAKNEEGMFEINVSEELPKAELVVITNNNKYHKIEISYFINGLIEK